MRLVHFFPTINTLGGVENVLRLHLAGDETVGLSSRGVFACEPMRGGPKWNGLGIRGSNVPAQMVHRLRSHLVGIDAFIFHNLWGSSFLEPSLPPSVLRVGMLHVDGKVAREALKKNHSRLDAILCVSEALARFAATLMPSENVHTISYPISPPPRQPDINSRRGTVGYCGRLLREQKRVDRLPDIFAKMLVVQPEMTLDVLGEGPESKMLRLRLEETGGTSFFHGRKSGSEYWETLQNWSVILFCSEYEGTPISLLEALSQGVLPIYPRIGSGGENYVEYVSERLLYDPDDLEAPARILAELSNLSAAEQTALRKRAIQSVAENTVHAYLARFRDIVVQIKPRIRPVASRRVLAQFVPYVLIRCFGRGTAY
jgi:glycosyltransferase involved in cell wall biosynthesis